MAIERENIEIVKGDTFTFELFYDQDTDETPVDMTDYDVEMVFLPDWKSDDPITTLTVGDGITLDEDEGHIVATLTRAQTAAFDFITAVYFLRVIAPGAVEDERESTTLVKGNVALIDLGGDE